ncbi:Salicylic acid-binding protein 2 [Zea mays]|uniref:Salicylic acid-binding protein 2 n=1 Tax=Zea mays TaxID=4577 RepID=A0A3L6G5A3_MAIZE|nr:Salicylic acid-binding protein 2 [Zea mays]
MAPVLPVAQGCGKHIVLVHGGCLGGWSWFKVATALRAAGYRTDKPDLAASGVDPRALREVPTFRDYTEPLLKLLASLPDGERVVLVGHSLGGVSVALAAETFPDKVAAVVFLCAFMPDCAARPSHVLEKLIVRIEQFVEGKWLEWMDTEVKPQDGEGKLPTSMLFGPRIIREKFTQLCSPEIYSMLRKMACATRVLKEITTLLAAIPTIGYARILDIGWEWAGVIWIYNVVTFLPMDMFKLAI